MSKPLLQPPSGAPIGFGGRMKQHILHPELSSNQVAWSFGLGFSIAWNPFLGLHTLMILLLCVCFRGLHRPLILAAAFINNPWTCIPIASASTYFGNLLMGRGLNLNLSGTQWKSIGWRSFFSREGLETMITTLKPILAPYLLGGLILSAIALPLGYYLMLKLTHRWRIRHAQTVLSETTGA